MEVEKGFMKFYKYKVKRLLLSLMVLALICTSSGIAVYGRSIGGKLDNLAYNDKWDKFNETKNYLDKYFSNFKVDIIKFDNIFVFYDKDGDGIYNKQGKNGDLPMKGVKVSINHWLNPTNIYPFTWSQNNGKASLYFPVFENIKDGYYLNVEIPEGYEINVTDNCLFGKDGNTAYNKISYKKGNGQGNGQGHGNLLTFAGKSEIMIPIIKKKEVAKADLTISSNDFDMEAIEGVNYDLYTYTNGGFAKTASARSDKNGKAVFRDLPVGSSVYVKATNLEELKLKAFEGLGSDGFSAFILINEGQNDLPVKLLKSSSLVIKSKLNNSEPLTASLTYDLYEINEDGSSELISKQLSQQGADVVFDGVLVGKQVYVEAMDYSQMPYKSMAGLGNGDGRSAPILIKEPENILEVIYY